MNTLRSTEKRLSSLLTLSRAICGIAPGKNGAKTQRPPQSSSHPSQPGGGKFANGKRYFTKSSSSLKPPLGLRVPKIKSYEVLNPTRSFSSSVANIPLLNPNKLQPHEAKELQIAPIVPLTLPRFPKNHGEPIPSVTKVLTTTIPASAQFLLDRWREAMIKKLGIAGFNKYTQETFERGRLLHALLASYLLGNGEPEPGVTHLSTEVVSNLWKSIQNVVREKISNVRLVEHIVTHPDMNYRGIVDCVAFYQDELVVIDFKTAEKPKKSVESLYDNPLQVTAYCGALNNDKSIPAHVIDRNICSGLVIVAYVDGSEASTYYLGPEKVANDYWKQWVTRLEQYSKLEEMKQASKKGGS